MKDKNILTLCRIKSFKNSKYILRLEITYFDENYREIESKSCGTDLNILQENGNYEEEIIEFDRYRPICGVHYAYNHDKIDFINFSLLGEYITGFGNYSKEVRDIKVKQTSFRPNEYLQFLCGIFTRNFIINFSYFLRTNDPISNWICKIKIRKIIQF